MEEFLPGAAALLDLVDKKLLVILRDGKKLSGYLRSYDQFANLVLQDTFETTYYKNQYYQQYVGMFVIRGENVALLGAIDEEVEAQVLGKLEKVDPDHLAGIVKQEQEETRKLDAAKSRVLHNIGFCVEFYGSDKF